MTVSDDKPAAGAEVDSEARTPSPKQSGSYLGYVADRLSEIVKIVSSLTVLVLLVMLCAVIYQESGKNYVIIEPFEVPKDFENRGLTGRTAANMLFDKMNDIKRNARSKMKGQKFLPAWFTTQLETKMPGSEISLKDIQKLINKLSGKKPVYITGYIISHNGLLRMTTRVTRSPAFTQEGKPEELDKMLLQAAEDIYRRAEPYLLAAYLSDTNQEASVGMIRYALSHEPEYDDSWAYNLWGNILSEQGDYDEAARKYRKAIEKAGILKQQFAAPHNGIGQVFYNQGKYAEACTSYQTACRLAPDMAEAYHNWGLALAKMNRSAEAIERFRMATKLDNGFTDAHVSWGIELMKQGKYEDAAARFGEAAEHFPTDGSNSQLARVYCIWGRSLLKLKRDSDAEAKFKMAAKLDPSLADTCNMNIQCK